MFVGRIRSVVQSALGLSLQSLRQLLIHSSGGGGERVHLLCPLPLEDDVRAPPAGEDSLLLVEVDLNPLRVLDLVALFLGGGFGAGCQWDRLGGGRGSSLIILLIRRRAGRNPHVAWTGVLVLGGGGQLVLLLHSQEYDQPLHGGR